MPSGELCAASELNGAAAATVDAWPDPESLPDDLPPVQRLATDLIPEALLSFVEDVAERMQVPIDYPVVILLLAIAGAVNRRVVIQPKANDTGWVVVPNLWGGIVAPPGYLRSPVIQAIIRLLNQIQEKWRSEHEDALQDHVNQEEEYELRHSAWKEQYKSAIKSGKEIPERPTREAEEPKLRRLVMNDATFEALHETLSDNPAGVLMVRDELPGWWSQLDRSGREGERAFYLQAWNADTGHTIDRIGRGTINVEACCVSMLGGIQPSRLRSYLADAVQDGPGNDGLVQRFQLLVWPDTKSAWKYVDRPPNAEAEKCVAQLISKLASLDVESPLQYRFSPEGQELFIEWSGELESKVRGEELHPALTCHISKYRSLMPSLAVLFELADSMDTDFDTNTVSLRHARQAAGWCDYLESHARRIYSCVVNPQLKAARDLANKIKRRQVGADGVFSCRDVYLKGWSGLDSTDAVKQALEVLEDAGWVRCHVTEAGPSGGRPSAQYEVNPKAVST